MTVANSLNFKGRSEYSRDRQADIVNTLRSLTFWHAPIDASARVHSLSEPAPPMAPWCHRKPGHIPGISIASKARALKIR